VSFVLVDRPRPQVAVVTLNRPERMNSMSFDVMVPLRDELRALSDDNEIRAVILTGAGSGFCSGADQSGEKGKMPNIAGLTAPTVGLRAMELLEDIVLTLRSLHQPVIAAVNGPAIGGGLCLALACDIRIAATSAYFRAAGINNGLTASELGLSYLLPRAIGSSRAFELMLTGRDIDAAEAATIGLVNRVVPEDELLDAAFEIAEQIAANTPFGVTLTKRVLNANVDAGSLSQAVEVENRGQTLATRGADFAEPLSAFREKRAAAFTSR